MFINNDIAIVSMYFPQLRGCDETCDETWRGSLAITYHVLTSVITQQHNGESENA